MDAEEPIDSEIEKDAVRPKCDDEAAAVDEDATNKQDKVTNEDVEIRTLVEER